jgi:DNA (cytosine-5)-methyltransferase 1
MAKKDYMKTVSADVLADILSASKATIRKWNRSGKIIPAKGGYLFKDMQRFPQVMEMINSQWNEQMSTVPVRKYSSIELFAGAGGLAIGLEKAGLEAVALNEFDPSACATLRENRPKWNVIEGDIKNVDFSNFNNIDFLSGGFPCQAFSYAGNKMGFEDTRGTLFFEFARAIKEVKPKVFLGENVRGLLNHENGETLKHIKQVINELGYTLIEPKVLKAMFHMVPQKRERLFLIGIRNDLVKYANFTWPDPYYRILTMEDALKKGSLYKCDVPQSDGQSYPARKKEILERVPPGGCWVDLPDELQREYMKQSYLNGGGKTGMARRLAWDCPSLTLTCAPAQKQTERCHPEETRPLTVREYARIQTFPDEWRFSGSLTNQYKQIGNAVPVNLAYSMGRRIVALLNSINDKTEISGGIPEAKKAIEHTQKTLFD